MKKFFLVFITFGLLLFLAIPDAVSTTFEDDVGYSISVNDIETVIFDSQDFENINVVACLDVEVPVLKYPINSYNMINLTVININQAELNKRGMDLILKRKHPISIQLKYIN